MAQFDAIKMSGPEPEVQGLVDRRPVDCACHLTSWFCAFQKFLSWKIHLKSIKLPQKKKNSYLKSCAIDDNLNPFAVNLHFSLKFLHTTWK